MLKLERIDRNKVAKFFTFDIIFVSKDYIIIIMYSHGNMDLILNVKNFTIVFSIFISLLPGERSRLVYLESNINNLRIARYIYKQYIKRD